MAHLQMPYHSSILRSIFVDAASPHALIAKSKSSQSQGAGGGTFKCPIFLPCVEVLMGGSGLRLKNSTFKPCHIIGQLGSGPYSVDGVEGRVLRTNF